METITNLAYLVSAVFFILGLKQLGSARTARRGNQFAAIGMAIAIIATLSSKGLDWSWIIAGVIVGGAIGGIAARRVQMTNMPEMVALFNGFGGGASALVALAEVLIQKEAPTIDVNLTVVLSLLVGMLTLTGSLIAFAKLHGYMKGAPIVLPMHQLLNIGMLAVVAAITVVYVINPSTTALLFVVTAIAAVLGVTFVIPIGGADMPVVISLLNSYSGIAASMTGFVLHNNVLIISGALVGASGLILTNIMCVAMNRSLANVLFGAVGTDDGGGEAVAGGEQRTVTGYTPEDIAMMFDSARSIIIVPGYGLAVAQAQHVLHEAAKLAMELGAKVRYAIHPVAGRMPGHMNVLLAEANVPYDELYEMDAINDDFKDTDVVLVVGANDVINPAARDKKGSPLYGMPILNVDYAKTVIILKRSMRAGFAGEDNELFFADRTMMVFGDAKDTLTKLVQVLKNR